MERIQTDHSDNDKGAEDDTEEDEVGWYPFNPK